MKISASNILSIGDITIGELSMRTISAVLGEPDQFASITSPDSEADRRWSWTQKGIDAVLNGNGSVISLAVDPNLTPVAIDGKLVPSARDLFLTRFKSSQKSGDLYELKRGHWLVEVAFQPERKGRKLGQNSRRIKLITVRSK